jgi:hypothetical protein
MVRNSDFFSNNVRTVATIIAGNPSARLIVDSASFGGGFLQGSGAFIGGVQTIN